MICDRLLIDLWRLCSSNIDHYWITFSKQRFHENEHPYNEKSTFSRFGGFGNRSKINLKTVSKITSNCGSNFGGIWIEFGGFSAPKFDQNRYQIRDRFLEASKIVFRSLIRGSLAPRPPPKDTFRVS